MAVLQVTEFSQSLQRTVNLQVILPMDKAAEGGLRTLVLLHGLYGSEFDWLQGTRVSRWARERGIAVIMPAAENRFYVDDDATGVGYGRFIGEELPAMFRAMLPLSPARDDLAIAGLSMGGYGALVNGLRYSEAYGHVAALSSALIIERVAGADNSAQSFLFRRAYYEQVFGRIDALPGGDKDYKALALRAKAAGTLPRLYMACGTEDALLESNRDYRDFLRGEGIALTYEEGPGGHDWDFWDAYILRVLNWFQGTFDK